MPNAAEKLKAVSPIAGDLEGNCSSGGKSQGPGCTGAGQEGEGGQASSPPFKVTAEPLAWDAPSPSGTTNSISMISLLLHGGGVMGSP